jgi:hypothetical protein
MGFAALPAWGRSPISGSSFAVCGPQTDELYSAAMRSQVAVFLALAGPVRRRNENHRLALKAHAAHLTAADTARI